MNFFYTSSQQYFTYIHVYFDESYVCSLVHLPKTAACRFGTSPRIPGKSVKSKKCISKKREKDLFSPKVVEKSGKFCFLRTHVFHLCLFSVEYVIKMLNNILCQWYLICVSFTPSHNL